MRHSENIWASGKAAHIAAEWPALEAVVGWIRAAGGVASLAHPARYGLSAGARRHLLADFAAAGGTALEVVTGGNGAQHVDGLRGARREASGYADRWVRIFTARNCLESPGPLA